MPHKRIDKASTEPAYAQLAAILRQEIALGVYPPFGKIPSESSISSKYRLSVMTVRQAIGLLITEGLLERIQGSGTFVKPVDLTGSRFDLGSIKDIFEDRENTRVKVLRMALARADAKTAQILRLQEGERVIRITRLLLRENRPVLYHEGRIRCDPTRPVVEAELNVGPLSDLFSGQDGSLAKKAELAILPAVLDAEEAGLFDQPIGAPVFRLEYLVYDFLDAPFGWGYFTAAPATLSLKAKLGIWGNS
ncbi:MAG: GntR family transcriptional regulator [Syntrophobacteraceae bacterium]